MHVHEYALLTIIVVLSLGCKAQTPADTPSQRKDTLVQPASTIVAERSDSAAIEGAVYDITYLTGRFNPASHPAFIVIPPRFRDGEVRYMRKEALAAFEKMHAAAARDGIQLVIISATRNFDVQKRIWENKWSGNTLLEGHIDARTIMSDTARARRILRFSSMPGTSRHHWGTDIDINSLENAYFSRGEGLKLYRWMTEHAHEYGFCQPYSALGTDRKTGYNEEKWHWTYMPLSVEMTQQAREKLRDDMINGFKGSETAMALRVVENYVLGISPACQRNTR